jgi:hypothetical protein
MAAFATPTKVLDGALVGPFGNPKQRLWLGSNLFGKASENLIRVTHPSYPQQEHPPIQPSSGPIDSTFWVASSGSLSASAKRAAFDALLEDVLASYDADPFSMQRGQDEPLGQMADLLSSEYRLAYAGVGHASR